MKKILFLLLMFIITTPAMAGDLFVGVGFGPAYDDRASPATQTVPGVAASEFGGDFARHVRVGYRINDRWFVSTGGTAPNDYKGTAFGIVMTGTNVGDTRDEEHVNVRSSDRAIDLLVGRRFAFNEFLALDLEAGVVAFQSDSMETRELRHYTYVAPGVLGPVSSSTVTTSSDDTEIGGALAATVTLHDDIVGASIGVKHYAEPGATFVVLGVTVGF